MKGKKLYVPSWIQTKLVCAFAVVPIYISSEAAYREYARWYSSKKYEIVLDGLHIGWICSYINLGYRENKDNILAIGLDIPEKQHRKKGYGSEAFQMYIDYLRKHGYKSFYTQTWSGNLAMIKVDAITWRLDFCSEGIESEFKGMGIYIEKNDIHKFKRRYSSDEKYCVSL